MDGALNVQQTELGNWGGPPPIAWMHADKLEPGRTVWMEFLGSSEETSKKGKKYRALIVRIEGKKYRIAEFSFRSEEVFVPRIGGTASFVVADGRFILSGLDGRSPSGVN